ncbi:MAG: hypothetical protein JNK64_26540 [Myxococcales bacterium]|nr:hypothetical protein [Myxococcales bacterium]
MIALPSSLRNPLRSRRRTALVVLAAAAALAGALALQPSRPAPPRAAETCGCAVPAPVPALTPRVSSVPALVIR